MSEQPFDTLTRRGVGDVSRRASLLTIGATGLATLLGGTLTVTARKQKHKNKNKDKQKGQQRAEQECAEQVAQCQSILTSIGGIPVNQLTCCNFLGTCDFPNFSLCFFGV
jgi:hypothetical protein